MPPEAEAGTVLGKAGKSAVRSSNKVENNGRNTGSFKVGRTDTALRKLKCITQRNGIQNILVIAFLYRQTPTAF